LLFAHRTEHDEFEWDKTFANVPAMLEAGVTEFSIAMPIGLKSPLSLDEIAQVMGQLANKAKQF
jgi:hypothetical protein